MLKILEYPRIMDHVVTYMNDITRSSHSGEINMPKVDPPNP